MKIVSVIALVIFLGLGINSLFVVQEGTRSIVILFGKVVEDAPETPKVYGPGLHLKLPLFARVQTLDAKIQTIDEAPDRFVTSEKEDLIVNSYVKWKIVDFANYYLATGGVMERAEELLKRRVTNGLRSEFGTRTIQQIVSGERSELMDEALKQAGDSSGDLGVEIIDVRVKQINLPREISANIFNRMRSERDAAAKEYRAEGNEQAEIIEATIDAKITVMLADAERNSRQLRGEGDALAAQIYAETYNKNPEFYAFLRSMDAYRQSFSNKSDILVIEPNSDFFRYMKQSSGEQ